MQRAPAATYLNLPVGKNDRKWFPKWIRRYASGLRKGKSETLPVEEAEVIRYLQSLRDHGVPAWQRLQAARAVEAYRKHISELLAKVYLETASKWHCDE